MALPDDIQALAAGTLSALEASHDYNGTANATYLAKAGARARCKDGRRLEIPEGYHRASWEMINKVIRDMSAAAIAKLGK